MIDVLIGDTMAIVAGLGHGERRFHLAGHDWGGAVAWNAALMEPSRFERVIGVNTPFFPRGPMKPTDGFSVRRVLGPNGPAYEVRRGGRPRPARCVRIFRLGRCWGVGPARFGRSGPVLPVARSNRKMSRQNRRLPLKKAAFSPSAALRGGVDFGMVRPI